MNASPGHPLGTDLSLLLRDIKAATGRSSDILIREFALYGWETPVKAAIVYVDGLANPKDILESVLQDGNDTCVPERFMDDNPLHVLKEYVLRAGDIQEIADRDALLHAVLSGDTAILVDGCATGIAASTREWKERGVMEPTSQTVIRGPREGFSEALRTNTALIRRKIKDPNLWLETKQIGRVTKTDIAVMYVKGIATDKVVQEVRDRLDRIDIDAVLESGYIEGAYSGRSVHPFPDHLQHGASGCDRRGIA